MVEEYNNMNDNYFDVMDRQLRIGDYYYANGMLNHEHLTDNECIGVVFAVGDDLAVEDRGQYYAYVVALSDLTRSDNAIFPWGVSRQRNECHRTLVTPQIKSLMFEDNSAMLYAQPFIDGKRHDDYPALYLPITLSHPNNSSNWILPSCAQWIKILRLIGIQTDNSLTCDGIINDVYDLNIHGVYWASHFFDHSFTTIVDINDSGVGIQVRNVSMDLQCRIRAILAVQG